MPVLAPQSWTDIRDAYVRGASASALARTWGVSPATIYRHAVAGGWAKSKRHAPPREAPAPAQDQFRSYPDTGAPWWNMKRPLDGPGEPPDMVADLFAGEMHEPGFLARMATVASGRALMNYDVDGARCLIRLADDYARVADRGRKPNLHTVMRAIFEKPFADELFAMEEGESNLVKEIYWEGMKKVEAEMAQRAAAAATEAEACATAPESAG